MADIRITEVEVMTGNWVDLIKFKYSDGKTAECGRCGGSQRPTFTLEKGEAIIAVKYCQGNSLDAVQFETNLGRYSQMYGNPSGGTEKRFEAPEGKQLWALRNNGNLLWQIVDFDVVDAPTKQQITEVEMMTGDLVDLIKFKYSDGKTAECGRCGGSQRPTFTLETGEAIIAVKYREGDSLDAMQFETNLGRRSQMYGNTSGGQEKRFEAPEGKQVWALRNNGTKCGRLMDFDLADAPKKMRLATRITEVEMMTGDWVDLIKFKYSDGKTAECGRCGGSQRPTFTLEKGEAIIAVKYCQGNSLDAVQFETNLGRRSQMYGNPSGGTEKRFEAPEGKQLWALRNNGNLLWQIVDFDLADL